MKWYSLLLMCSVMYGQFPNDCSGCQILETADMNNWPNGLSYVIDWNGSQSGTCTDYEGGCLETPCSFDNVTIKIDNGGNQRGVWVSWNGLIFPFYMFAGDPNYGYVYYDGEVECDKFKKITFSYEYPDGENQFGYIELRCTRCEKPFG